MPSVYTFFLQLNLLHREEKRKGDIPLSFIKHIQTFPVEPQQFHLDSLE